MVQTHHWCIHCVLRDLSIVGQEFPVFRCCWPEHLAFYRAQVGCTTVPDQLSLVGYALLGGSQPKKPVTWEFSSSQGTYLIRSPRGTSGCFLQSFARYSNCTGETVYTIHSFNPYHSHTWWNL